MVGIDSYFNCYNHHWCFKHQISMDVIFPHFVAYAKPGETEWWSPVGDAVLVSPWLPRRRSDWPGAGRPWSWPAGALAGGSICTCHDCSGLWYSPCRRWPNSHCHLPWLPPLGGRSGSRSHPVCSFLSETPGTPGKWTTQVRESIDTYFMVYLTP